MNQGRQISFLDATTTDLIEGEVLALGSFPEKPQLTDDGKFVKGPDFRVFKIGKNGSRKGTFTLTAENCKAIAAYWKQTGNWSSFDYQHGIIKTPPGQPIRSAGKCHFEARPDGLWATDVLYTHEAYDLQKKGEVENFSPLFNHRDGLITAVENVSLVMGPALHGDPRVAASAVAYASHPVIDGPWDADAAEHRLAKWASKDGSGDKDEMDWSKYGQGFAFVSGTGDKFGDFHLPHHDVQDGKLVTSKRGVEAAGAAVQGARGGARIPAEYLAAVKHHLAQHYHEWKAKAPWEQEATAALSSTAQERTMKATKLSKYLSGRIADHELEPKELATKCGIDHDKMMGYASGAEKPTDEHMEKMARGIGCKMSHLTKLAKEQDDDGEAEEKEKQEKAAALAAEKEKKDKEEKAAALAAQKLKDDKADGFSKLTALASGITDPTVKEAFAALIAINGAQAQALEAATAAATRSQEQLVALAAKEKEGAVAAVVDAAIAAGKITPAVRTEMLSVGRADLTLLQGLIEKSPKLGPGVAPVQTRTQLNSTLELDGQVAASAFIEMSEDLGVSVEQLQASHKRRVEWEAKLNAAGNREAAQAALLADAVAQYRKDQKDAGN